MRIMRLTDTTFDDEVLSSDVPVLVDFWASWCPPCKMVEPLMDEIAEELDGAVKLAKINVDQSPKSGARYKISGVPTFILFINGEPEDRRVGAQSREQLLEIIKRAINEK
jgi:thioredoxin 1